MKSNRSLVICAALVLLVYAMSLFIEQGWITYLLSAPAFLTIGLTSLARANAIHEDSTGPQWDSRRMGFATAGSTALVYLVGPIFEIYPNWLELLMAWGVANVWLTTPNMPPWWKWWSGEWKDIHVKEQLKSFVKSLFGK